MVVMEQVRQTCSESEDKGSGLSLLGLLSMFFCPLLGGTGWLAGSGVQFSCPTGHLGSDNTKSIGPG